MEDRPLSDDELLQLLEAREEAARLRYVESLPEERDEEAEAGEPGGDPCPHCGEPALDFDACDVCGADGCLPRDDWQPGWADACLSRCARCGRLAHVTCMGRDEAGNLACCGPRVGTVDDW